MSSNLEKLTGFPIYTATTGLSGALLVAIWKSFGWSLIAPGTRPQPMQIAQLF